MIKHIVRKTKYTYFLVEDVKDIEEAIEAVRDGDSGKDYTKLNELSDVDYDATIFTVDNTQEETEAEEPEIEEEEIDEDADEDAALPGQDTDDWDEVDEDEDAALPGQDTDDWDEVDEDDFLDDDKLEVVEHIDYVTGHKSLVWHIDGSED